MFIIVLLWGNFQFSQAQVSITTPSITVTACNTFPTAPKILDNIVIAESATNDISGSGTIILSTPSTFQFTGAGSVSVNGGELTSVSISHTGNTTITLTYTVTNTILLDTITLSGISVRGIFVATPASNIIRSGGTGIINGDTLGSIHATVISTDAPVLNSGLTPPAICSGDTFSYNPTSTQPGTTFSWTRAAVTGISDSSDSGTNNPLETLTDTIANPVNVTYTYSLTANGCTNPTTFNVVLAVNPIPDLSSSLSPPATCSDVAFSYSPGSLTPGTIFSWTRDTVGGISNAASTGTGNPNEILTDTTALPVNVSYSYSLSANGCSNPTYYNVTTTVNPAPEVVSILNDTICNNDTLAVTLSASMNSTFSWFAYDNVNTTGESITTQTGDTIDNILTNNATAIQTVNYAVIANSIANSCPSDTAFFSINIIPTVTVDPINEYIAGFSVELSIPLTSNVPAVFNWNAANNTFVSGESSSPVTSDTIIQTLLNNDTLMHTVEYYVTPTSLLKGCTGIIDTFKVILNANNKMTSPDSIYVCSGSPVNLALTSELVSTYKWITNENVNTTGESTTLQINDTITDVLYNNTDTIQIINYTVTPNTYLTSMDGTPQNLTVILHPKLSLNAGNTLSFCSGTANNIASTLIQNCTYLWTPGTSLNDSTIHNPLYTAINNTSSPIAIEYSILISDTISACQAIDSISITVNPLPNLTINNPSAVCFPNTVDLTDTLVTFGSTNSGLLSYWTNSTATDTLLSPNSISISDTNFIKITAIGGCSVIDSVFAIINPAPLSNAGSDLIICSGIVDSIGTGATAGYSYSWSPATGLNDSTVSNPINTTLNNTNAPVSTNYILTTKITATGCESRDSATITVNPNPVLIINAPPAVCMPNTIDLTVTSITMGSTGGGTYSYWTNSTATDTLLLPSAIAVNDTNYIKVTTIDGCTDIDSVITIVNPVPIVNAGTDLNLCSGIIDNIGSPAIMNYTYSWTPGADLNDSTISAPIITAINNTSSPIVKDYILTALITSTGCQSVDTITVTVNHQPVLIITNPAPSCSLDSIDLTEPSITAGSTGGGILSYWTNASATNALPLPTAVAVSDTNYIKVTTAGGCTDIEPIVTIINPLPLVSFTGLNYSNCYNSSPQTLIGSPPGGIFSGNGVSGDTFTASIAGSGVQPVTYTYTDTNGCFRSASQFIQILPLSNITPVLCMVTVDTASNSNIIYWDKTAYTNVDSFIVYREIASNSFERIGAVSRNLGKLVDTTQQQYFPNTGDPNVGSYRYRLQIRDTCGDYTPLSTFHKSIYLTHTEGTFNWTHYEIENEPVPLTELSAYVLLRDGNNTGNWDVVGSSFGSTLSITDANYSSYPNGRWRIETLWSLSCSGINTTRSNIITDTTSNGISSIDNFSVPFSIYPNPYAQSTSIHYVLNNKSDVTVEIFNTLGEKIQSLVNSTQQAGDYKHKFSAKELGFSAGVYFVKISVDGKSTIRRIVETQ